MGWWHGDITLFLWATAQELGIIVSCSEDVGWRLEESAPGQSAMLSPGTEELSIGSWGWVCEAVLLRTFPTRHCFATPHCTHPKEINSASPTNASQDYLCLPVALNKFLNMEWTFKSSILVSFWPQITSDLSPAGDSGKDFIAGRLPQWS